MHETIQTPTLMARKKSPQYWAAALLATAVAGVSYKAYQFWQEGGESRDANRWSKFRHKRIALTLLHSVLLTDLPLADILMNSENVTFILPPYLSVDDVAHSVSGEEASYALPHKMIKNYKFLQCSNINGYFQIVKNLQPDILFVCSDDLGITQNIPKDLGRFVKEIVTFEQDKLSVKSILSKVFIV